MCGEIGAKLEGIKGSVGDQGVGVFVCHDVTFVVCYCVCGMLLLSLRTPELVAYDPRSLYEFGRGYVVCE